AASPGRATAPARVILDPHAAQLAHGEILVAPSTDPGWTPLFLTAGGLVMETGGAMSHGAIVAREYGIPAVVGVAGATERIQSGQTVTVDGTTGTVTLALGDDATESTADVSRMRGPTRRTDGRIRQLGASSLVARRTVVDMETDGKPKADAPIQAAEAS